MKPVTVAQIGCGYWGPNLLRALHGLPGVAVKWLCDLKPGRLAWAKSRFPRLHVTARAEELLEDGEVDAVVLATEVITHYGLARAVLNAGKHAFVEKPLAKSLSQAKELASLAAKKRLVLEVGHVYLYHPAVQALNKELKSGRLGKLLYLDLSRVNPGPPNPRHDVIWDMAPHDAALALHLAGAKPRSVRATGRRWSNPQLDEAASFEIDFKNGVWARVHVSWLSAQRVRRLEAYGSKGTAFFDDAVAVEKLKFVLPGQDNRAQSGATAKTLSYGVGELRVPALTTTEPLMNELADFISCVRRGRRPLSGAGMGVEVVRVLEAAAASAASGGRVVRL